MTTRNSVTMEQYRVSPGTSVDLGHWSPDGTATFEGSRKEAEEETRRFNARLESLQELLYAEGKHKVLVILQAMDTGGKDSTIRHVFDGVNPQGVRVASFRAPTPQEWAHDFLWRVHRHAPGNGELVIFNRSHYESVLIERVHDLAPPQVWSRRYAHINHFEQLLADEGTTILKFYLHIDREEQQKRLQARLDDPKKHWKFDPQDLEERKRWPEYMEAYNAALSRTSTPWAPWFIVPANRKWYRNLVISHVIVDALENLHMQFPPAPAGLERLVVQ